MGWLFMCDPGVGRKQLVERLRRPDRFGENAKLLQACTVGNHHWYLVQTGDKVRIGLDLMQGGGRNQGWGYKDMDESCGPCQYDVPISYLAKASPATGYAVAWRDEVLKRHAERKAKSEPVKGMIVEYGGHRYELWNPAGPRKGWNVVREPDGAWFRMSAYQLAKAKEVKPAAATA